MKTIGPYQVLQQLGASAAGFTYKVFDTSLKCELAVKELASAHVTPTLKSKFGAKLAACKALKHPNLAEIRDSGDSDGSVYIATTYVEGVNANHEDAKALSLERKLRLVAQVAEGLANAHGKGIAHGNLKPTNVLFSGGQQGIILDIGTGDWQALILASGERLPGLIPNYLSPEQILGQPFDGRSDIFSLAMVLYELVTGQHAFPVPASLIIREIIHATPEPMSKFCPDVPEALDKLVESAMMKNPFQRMQTADEFAAGLYSIAQQIRLMAAEKVPVCPDPPAVPIPMIAPEELAAVVAPPQSDASRKVIELTPVAGNIPLPVPDMPVHPAPVLPPHVAAAPPAPVAQPVPVQATLAPQAPNIPAPQPVPQMPPPMAAQQAPVQPMPVQQAAPQPMAQPMPPPQPPPMLEPPPPVRPVAKAKAAAATAKGNRLRNSVIAITVAGVLAIAVVEVFFTRSSLNASPPKAQINQAAARPAEQEMPKTPEPLVPAAAAAPVPGTPLATPEPGKAAPHPEAVFRNQVRQLWEAGKYAQAMQVVNALLAADPENMEGRLWKKKIHASQVAEAEIK